jgi:hypothetical protein
MSNGDNGDKSNLKNSALNRRNILLGGVAHNPKRTLHVIISRPQFH